MNQYKSGIHSSEFWLSTLGVLLTSVLALLVGYGVINSEQKELWAAVGMAALPILVYLGSTITKSYTESRTDIKIAHIEAQTKSMELAVESRKASSSGYGTSVS